MALRSELQRGHVGGVPVPGQCCSGPPRLSPRISQRSAPWAVVAQYLDIYRHRSRAWDVSTQEGTTRCFWWRVGLLARNLRCDGRLTWTYSEVKLLSKISRMVGTCFSMYGQRLLLESTTRARSGATALKPCRTAWPLQALI